MERSRAALATELLDRFLERGARYLWTDAFAVCTLVGLGRVDDAVALVDQVHGTLGKHRGDDGRTGWLSGDEAHPTAAGLRIGKPLPERAAGEPPDDQLEWDRDGQYFHYLTKWMHALDRVGHATGDARYRAWARELAVAAHRAFCTRGRRMIWKASIDLTRPLVSSMGQHDPLDGYVTAMQLGEVGLAADYRDMLVTGALVTSDPLGVGGLLVDAARLEALGDLGLRGAVIEAAVAGLRDVEIGGPAAYRLAFRELGLAIGLAAAELLAPGVAAPLAPYRGLHDAIVAFWLREEHRSVRSWRDHEDINDVMLAATLAPEGFLARAPKRPE